MKLQELSDKTIGLVLSGGGVKGVAHVGIIKALNERNIYPDIISGVSAGAMVGALYANGVSHVDMLHFFKETPLFKYNFFTINKPGLFDTEKYLVFLEKYFPINSFKALKRELHVVATNLQKGIPEFFSSGDLLQPILASAALPPVFSPVIINGDLYADGGIMNNFPIEPLIGKTEIMIGAYTSAMKNMPSEEMKNALQIMQRANVLMLHSNCMDKLNVPDLLFKPKDLENIGVLDKKGIDKAFFIGYECASRMLDTFIWKDERLIKEKEFLDRS
jgi:NTE family protein